MNNGTGITELQGFTLGQTAHVEINGEYTVSDGWHTVKITNLVDDQGGWCETSSRTGGWSCEMFPLNCMRHVPSNEAVATEKQMAYLKDLGYDGDMLARSDASEKIDEWKAWKNAVGPCHYCGAPAYGFGFFDEPNCEQCS